MSQRVLPIAIRAALIAGLASGQPALAQEEDPAELDKISVTGSRIKRTDIETAAPVLVIQREDIERSGLQSIGDFLQELSIAGAAINTQFNNAGNGQTQIDLRNLGAERVLVLLDGRRFETTLGIDGSSGVDLNNIPVAIIKRIEILKDGASSIYGSDAIVGVINIITRDDFDGFQANAYYGQFANENDGDVQSFDVSAGASSDRGNIFFSASYVEQKPVFAADREISAVPVAGTGNLFGSPAIPQGVFVLPPLGEGAPPRFRTSDPNADVGGLGADAFRPFSFGDPVTGEGSDFFNFAPDNYLLTPQQRTSVFTQISYDITDWMRFRGNVNYVNRESEQLLAPEALGIGIFGRGVAALQASLGADAPFNPFGEPVAGIQRRMVEAGPRTFAQNSDAYRFSAGLEGSFQALDRYFDWDVNWIYGVVEENQISEGSQNFQRIAQALDPTCFDDPAVPCLNLFGGQGPDGQGTISQEALDFILFTAQNTQEEQLTNYTANISGDLFELPAGPLGFATGYEYRDEEAFRLPDSLIASGLTSGNPVQPAGGGFSVDEFYLELAVPILEGLPLAERLSLSLSSRYSDYSSFGDTINSKVGIEWQPIGDLLLRGTYSEGFRAPTVGNLFLNPVTEFGPIQDPCSDFLNPENPAAPDVVAACIADGVPADGSYVLPLVNRTPFTTTGNLELQPESSTSFTAGAVFSPSWLPGFDLSVDYYDIEVEDVITDLSFFTLFDACYGTGTLIPDPFFCQFIARNTLGEVTEVTLTSTNAASLQVSGIDLAASYSFPETPIGFFRAIVDVAWQRENVLATPTGSADRVGIFDQGGFAAFPEYRINTDVIWTLGNWEGVYSLQFIDDLQERCASRIVADAQFAFPECQSLDSFRTLEAVWYHDVQVSYFFSEFGARLTGGVRNVTNELPPVSTQAFANSFGAAQYRTPGRFPYVRLTVDF